MELGYETRKFQIYYLVGKKYWPINKCFNLLAVNVSRKIVSIRSDSLLPHLFEEALFEVIERCSRGRIEEILEFEWLEGLFMER